MIVGLRYLEHGLPVVVLVQWAHPGPRNVLIERVDGERVVRPFRGLRRVQPASEAAGKPQIGARSCVAP